MSLSEALDRSGIILTPLQSKELQLYKGDRDLDEWILIFDRLGNAVLSTSTYQKYKEKILAEL